jgi:hypothetical protein
MVTRTSDRIAEGRATLRGVAGLVPPVVLDGVLVAG